MTTEARLEVEIDGSGAQRGAAAASDSLDQLKESAGGADAQIALLQKQMRALSDEVGDLKNKLAASESALVGETRATGNAATSKAILQHVVRSSADSFAAGASASQIFGQEMGRLAEAAEFAGGSFGKLGEFLSGPWGLAVQLGVAVLSVFVGKLLETEGAGGKAETALHRIEDIQRDLGAAIDQTTGKINAQNAALAHQASLAAPSTIRAGKTSLGQDSLDAFDQVRKTISSLKSLSFEGAGGGVGFASSQRLPTGDVLALSRALADANGNFPKLVANVTALGSTNPKILALQDSLGGLGVKAATTNKGIHELAGSQYDYNKALTGGAIQTTETIDRAVALKTATDGVSKAQATLNDVKSRGEQITKMDGGPDKDRALAQYSTDLTAATKSLHDEQQAVKDARSAHSELSKEQREAAKAARELDSDYASLTKRLEPLTAALDRYYDDLKKIQALVAAGKLTPDQGSDFDGQARSALLDAEDQIDKAHQEKTLKDVGLDKTADDFGKEISDQISSSVAPGSAVDHAMQELSARTAAALAGLTVDQFNAIGALGDAASSFGNIIGGKTGSKLNSIGSSISNITSGKSDVDAQKFGAAIEKISKGVGLDDKTSSQLGALGQQFGANQAIIGATKAISDPLIKAIGLKTSTTGGEIGGQIGGFAFGPLGAIGGEILGSIVGGLFKKTPKGSATIGNVDGEAQVTGTSGNSGAYKKIATGLGDAIDSTLEGIIRQFDAGLGDFNIKVGKKGKKFFVDDTPDAAGGKEKFKTAEEAEAAAVRDAINQGAIKGITDTQQRIIKSAKDLTQGLQDALTVGNVKKALKAYDDPVNAALDDLNTQFQQLADILHKAAATPQELADAERLYNIQRQQIITQANDAALKSMKDYLAELTGGSDSPLSPQLRYQTTRSALNTLDTDRAAGTKVDFADYQKAANDFLSASRDFQGSTVGYFADFKRVTGTVQSLIDAQQSTAITTPPVDFSPVVSAITDTASTTNTLLKSINDRLGLFQTPAAAAAAAAAATKIQPKVPVPQPRYFAAN